MFVTKDAYASGIEEKIVSAERRKAQPAGSQHPQKMSAGKKQDVTVEGADAFDHGIGASGSLRNGFAAGTTVPEN